MKLLKKLSLGALAALVTVVAFAQTPTIFNLIRVNTGIDARGIIENQTGIVTVDDDFEVTGDAEVTGTLTVGGIAVPSGALTRVDDTNVTLTLGGSPSTALLNATSLTLGWTGQLAVARGGTGAATLTGLLLGNGTSAFTALTATDDSLPVGNGSTYQVKTLPDCDDTGGNHLNYDTTANTFACGNSGGGTATPGGADTQVQYNNAGALGGDSGLTFNNATNDLTVGGELNAADLEATDDLVVGDDANITGTLTVGNCIGCTATPGGADTQVQYNDGGVLNGEAGMTYNETTDALTIAGIFQSAGALFTSAVELTYSTARVIIDDSSGSNNSCVQFQDNNVTQGFVCSANAAGQVANSSNAGDIVIRADNSGELIWTPDSGSTTVDFTPSTGTFVLSFDGACTTTPTMTIRYMKVGSMVVWTGNSSGDAFNCTSDSGAFSTSDTAVPAAIRPTISTAEIMVHAVDNGVPVVAVMLILTNGNVQINRCDNYGGSGNPCVGGWTSSGVKALNNISGAYSTNI